jgi:conjugative transfer signal peptidase TraF
MPRGIYREVDLPLAPGALVSACVPPAGQIVASERHYLGRGACPGNLAPLVKPVLAGPGDLVDYDARGLSVNGRLIPNTAPYDTDRAGRTLLPHPFGAYRLGPGYYWLFSPHHPRSWDSRYFGPVPESYVIHAVAPLWTVEAL